MQTDQLTAEMSIMDNATAANLENLVKCAEEMLKAVVKRVNPVTFELEPIDDGTTYAQALTRYILYIQILQLIQCVI